MSMWPSRCMSKNIYIRIPVQMRNWCNILKLKSEHWPSFIIFFHNPSLSNCLSPNNPVQYFRERWQLTWSGKVIANVSHFSIRCVRVSECTNRVASAEWWSEGQKWWEHFWNHHCLSLSHKETRHLLTNTSNFLSAWCSNIWGNLISNPLTEHNSLHSKSMLIQHGLLISAVRAMFFSSMAAAESSPGEERDTPENIGRRPLLYVSQFPTLHVWCEKKHASITVVVHRVEPMQLCTLQPSLFVGLHGGSHVEKRAWLLSRLMLYLHE